MGILGTGPNGRITIEDWGRANGLMPESPATPTPSAAATATPTPKPAPTPAPQPAAQNQAPMSVNFQQQPSQATSPAIPNQAPAHFDSIQQGAIQNAQNVDLGQLQRLADDATFQRLTPAQQQEYVGLALAFAGPNMDTSAAIGKAFELMTDRYGYQINAGGVGKQLNPTAMGSAQHNVSTYSAPDGFYSNLMSGVAQQNPELASIFGLSSGGGAAQQPGMAPGMGPGLGQMPPGSDYFNNLLQQQLGGLQGQFSEQLGGLQQQFMQYQQEQMAQAKARDEMLERIMQAQMAAQRNAQTQQAIGSGQPVASQRP
ncbi:MAG TPA: hypothetical protein DDZ92_03910, partial [Halomonas sp.]|nr:hypothetical protein [Halomonas sp.]